MTYTIYYQGVQVISNIPTDIGKPGNYDIKIYWSDNALGWIESKVAEGFSVLNNYSDKIIAKTIQEFENAFGSNHISNLTFNANNQYAEFTFTLSSPTIFDWIGIIIGVVIWGLAIATALIPGVDIMSIGSAIIYTFLIAIGVSALDWFISKVDVVFSDITQTFGKGLGTAIEIAIVVAILMGLGFLGLTLYSKYDKSKSDKNG